MTRNFFAKILKIGLIFSLISVLSVMEIEGCTSALVGVQRGKDGRWLLWKHRDSGHPDNYVCAFPRIEEKGATDSTAAVEGQFAYVALFNAADTDAREAWIGFNEAGFAVMNTATYNIPAPRKGWEDREGFVMSEALRKCSSLVDFYQMLTQMPLPRGVQANFGAFDAQGHGAYFETDDYGCVPFPLDSISARHLGVNFTKQSCARNNNSEVEKSHPNISDLLIRTNFSLSGGDEKLLGYSRFLSENHQLDSIIATDRPWAPAGKLSAEDFIETLSRSLWLPANYPTMDGLDLLDGTNPSYPDNGDVISRRSSCASVVIEGPLPGEHPAKRMIMWTAIGFPTLSVVEAVTIDSVPPQLKGVEVVKDGKCQRCSELCDSINILRQRAFIPSPKGSKPKYRFDLRYLRNQIPLRRALSLPRYQQSRDAIRNDFNTEK